MPVGAGGGRAPALHLLWHIALLHGLQKVVVTLRLLQGLQELLGVGRAVRQEVRQARVEKGVGQSRIQHVRPDGRLLRIGVEQLVGLRHRLQVGERRGDHLAVVQGQVDHLVVGVDVVDRYREDGLRRDPC